jgi:hypothetical protein
MAIAILLALAAVFTADAIVCGTRTGAERPRAIRHGLGAFAVVFGLAMLVREMTGAPITARALLHGAEASLAAAGAGALFLFSVRKKRKFLRKRDAVCAVIALAAILASRRVDAGVVIAAGLAAALAVPRLLALPEGLAWPHLRAGLITLHLIAIVLVAIPAPVGGMDRSAWKDPTVQAEFSAWSARLGVSPKSLEDRVWSLANLEMGARDRITSPVWPYIDFTGTDQPWRMFVAPHRFPSRWQIQVRRAGAAADDFETVFEERSREHRWREDFFRQERVRSGIFRYSWPEYSYDAGLLCDWSASRLFEEQPDVVEVRCRFYKAPSPSPEQVLSHTEPEGHWEQEHRVRRPGDPPPAGSKLQMAPLRLGGPR